MGIHEIFAHKFQPHKLASPGHSGDLFTDKKTGKWLILATVGAGVPHSYRLKSSPHHVGLKTPADGLDFRQFRHA